MPCVRADISFFIEIGSFHNIDLFQRGYYQVRYYLKVGNSTSSVNTFGQSAIAIYHPVIFGDNSTASIYYGQVNAQPLPPKGCSTTIPIMYHKESASLNDAFEQQIQVNVDINQLENVFSQTELLFCAELWFAEENERNISNDKLELLVTRQKRIQMSPIRGLCHQFNVIFDFSHLCAVGFFIQGYLTNILPGLYRSTSISNNLHSLIAYENYAKQNWRDVIGGGPALNETKRHYAIATHRHLCQALLSSRERMIIFWHEIAIFLKNHFQPSAEVTDLRGLLERITSHFQQLRTEIEMAKQIAKDVTELGGDNILIFHQLCEFIHATPKVMRHIQRKSHQIRMKRLAEAFFVQEFQIPQILAVYDPATVGHEAMAAAVRQSAYFQRLPELPVSCRQFDGDASNIPIIFEDVYLPLTEAQRNGNIGPEVAKKSIPLTSEDVCLRKNSKNCPTPLEIKMRPRSLLSGRSISSFDDPAIVDLLSTSTTSTDSSVLRRVRRRGQRLVFQSDNATTDGFHSRRRGRLNRLYRTIVHSEVAEVVNGSDHRNGGPDIRLMGYRRIVDDTFECFENSGEEMKEKEKSMERDYGFLNGQKDLDKKKNDGRGNQSAGFDSSTRKCVSLMSLPSADSSKMIRRVRQQHQNHHQNHSSQNPLASSSSSSRQMEHSSSTPNLDLTALTSSLAAAASADTLAIKRCPRCGLPDLSTITATTAQTRKNGNTSTMVTSLSLPSLSSLDPAAVAAAMASSSLSDSAGLQGGRPSMRRLKHQKRNKTIFPRKNSSKNYSTLSAHIYTEDLVNFGSISDLLTRSCHCEKSTDPSTSLTRNRREGHSTSIDFSTALKNSPSTPVTDFCRSRWELSTNPLTLPSLSEDLRDPELEGAGVAAPPRRADSSETVEEFLIALGTEGEDGEAEEAEVEVETDAADDTTKRQSVDISSWLIRNPENGIAMVRNKITRRSLSQTFITTNDEDEKSLIKHQMVNLSRPVTSANSTECLEKVTTSSIASNTVNDRLVNAFTLGTMTFVMLKEHLKQNVLQGPTFKGHIYSDFSQLPVPFPYFSNPSVKSSAVHLVICVHGLEGNCLDLRLLTTYLQLALPDHPLEFLMSDSNHEDTFASLEQLRDNLVQEIIQHIQSMAEKPTHISFIGHSLGCVLIRAALSSPLLIHLYPRLHTFLSFCGPHLGTLYSTSGLVSAGMWALQKLKKSRSLLQLRLRDHADPRETFMYSLSAAEGLDSFRHLLLVASPQDHYVPHHSSRIELCRSAVQDPSEMGTVYMEMVANILQRLIKSTRIRSVVRYDVHYETQASANHFIGRAAHIAVLDSDVFMEKFFCVSAAKFFRIDTDDNSNCKVTQDDPSTSTQSSIFSDVSLVNGN